MVLSEETIDTKKSEKIFKVSFSYSSSGYAYQFSSSSYCVYVLEFSKGKTFLFVFQVYLQQTKKWVDPDPSPRITFFNGAHNKPTSFPFFQNTLFFFVVFRESFSCYFLLWRRRKIIPVCLGEGDRDGIKKGFVCREGGGGETLRNFLTSTPRGKAKEGMQKCFPLVKFGQSLFTGIFHHLFFAPAAAASQYLFCPPPIMEFL